MTVSSFFHDLKPDIISNDFSGYIDREEIKAIMCRDATDEEIDELLDLADTNKDGKLDCEGRYCFLHTAFIRPMEYTRIFKTVKF